MCSAVVVQAAQSVHTICTTVQSHAVFYPGRSVRALRARGRRSTCGPVPVKAALQQSFGASVFAWSCAGEGRGVQPATSPAHGRQARALWTAPELAGPELGSQRGRRQRGAEIQAFYGGQASAAWRGVPCSSGSHGARMGGRSQAHGEEAMLQGYGFERGSSAGERQCARWSCRTSCQVLAFSHGGLLPS